MKARFTKTGITITGILNESLTERVATMATKSGATATYEQYGTRAKIGGSAAQINKFAELWNSGKY
jgi:hypothetical protein